LWSAAVARGARAAAASRRPDLDLIVVATTTPDISVPVDRAFCRRSSRARRTRIRRPGGVRGFVYALAIAD
jgi:hypothetical protein